MGTEDGIRRIFQVCFRVISDFGDHLLLILTGGITARGTAEPTPAPGIGCHLHGVAAQGGDGNGTGEDGQFPLLLLGEGGGHGPQISNGAAHLGLGEAQAEPIVGFQQNALRLHQPLAQGPVGGLPEVAAFGVLQMGPASSQSNFHIGDGRAGEHVQVGLFLEMGENQPLPGSL